MYLLIHAAKAEPVGDQEIDDVKIVIEASDLSRERMAEDAGSIAEALRNSLPQGTWIKLMAEVAALWAKDMQGHISAAEWYG